MELKTLNNEKGNFIQWYGVDYSLACQQEPICFVDENIDTYVSGVSAGDSCDIGQAYKLPFKSGDTFSFQVSKHLLGDVNFSFVKLAISKRGVVEWFDIATVIEAKNHLIFQGTMPNLENDNYEFIIYYDDTKAMVIDIVSKTNNSNDQECLGQIEISVSGGVPPYSYRLNNLEYQETPVFSGLCNGYYTITVKDSECNISLLNFQIRTFPGCEFFADKTIGYLCQNGWTTLDICNCNLFCEFDS